MRNMKFVDVFGKRFKIKHDPALSAAGTHGVTCVENKLILIDPKLKGEEFNQVMLHEQFHAVFDRLGIRQAVKDEVEEMIVDALATFMIDNYVVKPKK